MMLDNIRIVLVRTFHPGNIGSAARAMKTMGLNDLYLVDPVDFNTKESLAEAHKMAMSADDVVEKAKIVDDLYAAVKDCSVIIASTARSRGYDLPELSPEESAKKLISASASNNLLSRGEKVALVFGPERMGLSNDDLQYAKYRVTIPTSPDYSSLNLAAAVQTLSYEVYKEYLNQTESADSNGSNETKPDNALPTSEALEQYYQHLEETLTDTGFIIKNHPGEIVQKLRSLFNRTQLETSELNILRGILASIQRFNK